MLQWITALEKVARESHYTGKNRFDSFAPIRLNVAAQWLVDGVSSAQSIYDSSSQFGFSVTISGTCLVPSFLQRNASIFMIGGSHLVCPNIRILYSVYS